MAEHRAVAEYLAAGANRHASVADWSAGGVLAFGADCNVALWRPSDLAPRGIFALLSGHTDVVKAVKFLPRRDGEEASFLVTGADDKSLRLWSLKDDGSYECVQALEGAHSAPINCLGLLLSRSNRGRVLLASGGADATVHVWTFVSDRLHLVHTLRPSPKLFPLTIALASLDENDEVFVLAVAGTRDTIQIFVTDSESAAQSDGFVLQATLSGHEGWIRSLELTFETATTGSDLLLASASQDKYIRLWRLHQGKELPALKTSAVDPLSAAYLPGKSPSNKAYKLKSGTEHFSITFEALLLGHEDWLYSARWFLHADGKLQLLSASADNSLNIWEADADSGIWVSVARLGEISREKGATTATGSIGGFWTGLWSPDGCEVVTLGRTGSWRRWEYSQAEDRWAPLMAISGHTRAVTGIAWSKDGQYLVSTSADQTTRLHAPWARSEGPHTWHEMSRPQIHGYDLNCIDTLDNVRFVSGADEKLMRVFTEPKAVGKLLKRLSRIADDVVSDMPDAANMPMLGLSNKAIDAVGDDEVLPAPKDGDREGMDPASTVRKSALELDHPPLEENLSRHTLWPEIEKLYGHGYEISCLAASHDGTLIASACKASSVNHAVIRLFETKTWTEVRPPLMAHSLTATRLRFSPDDRYLLSVGRDRQWAVFERVEPGGQEYKLLQANPKGHSRMILDASWAPQGLGTRLFATAGRDKKTSIWLSEAKGGTKDEFKLGATYPEDAPITAVDFLGDVDKDGRLVLAAGTESGKIVIRRIGLGALDEPTTVFLDPNMCLPKAVLQFAWQPRRTEETEAQPFRLAIAGEDSSLRILSFPR